MPNIDKHVEIKRLATLFAKPESELDYLQALDGEGLQTLRKQFQNALINEYEPILGKLASTAKLSPEKLSVMICTKILGPVLTGYMAYFTAPSLAAKLSKRFSPEFMAETAAEMIPERAEALLDGMPVDLMRETTRILAEEQQWYVMGGYVDFMPEEKNVALMDEIKSPADNLRISMYAQNKPRIAGLVEKFDDARIIELIRASLAEDDMMREICIVGDNLSATQKQRMVGLASHFSEQEIAKLSDYAASNGYQSLLDEVTA